MIPQQPVDEISENAPKNQSQRNLPAEDMNVEMVPG